MVTRRKHSKEFKLDSINLVLEQNYSHREAAHSPGISAAMLRRWMREYQADEDDGHLFRGNGKLTQEQAEIRCLKEENKRLKIEKEILKRQRSSLPEKHGEIRVYYPA